MNDIDVEFPRKAQAPQGVPEGDQCGQLALSDLLAADWNGENDAWDYQESPHDNTRRAGFALAALKAFAKRVGGFKSEPTEQQIGDLLCDLHHLCDALGIDFASVLDDADFHYSAELRGE